jgi:hypothetical protein
MKHLMFVLLLGLTNWVSGSAEAFPPVGKDQSPEEAMQYSHFDIVENNIFERTSSSTPTIYYVKQGNGICSLVTTEVGIMDARRVAENFVQWENQAVGSCSFPAWRDNLFDRDFPAVTRPATATITTVMSATWRSERGFDITGSHQEVIFDMSFPGNSEALNTCGYSLSTTLPTGRKIYLNHHGSTRGSCLEWVNTISVTQ